MITMRLKGDERVIQRFYSMPDDLRQKLRYAIEIEAMYETAYIKNSKLSGQVLHVRTGTLRRSITHRLTSNESSVKATIGTNVIYAAIHEYGGIIHQKNRVIHMPMRSFMRSTLKDNKQRIINAIKNAVKMVMK